MSCLKALPHLFFLSMYYIGFLDDVADSRDSGRGGDGNEPETKEDAASDEVDKYSDLTAIYENQVFVLLEKLDASPERRKWFSPLRNKKSPEKRSSKIIVGQGTVLIDQRR